MARHNLQTVVAFEVTRTLTKRRFWIGTLLVPLAMGLVIGLIVLSSTATAKRVSSQSTAQFTFTYSDASGYVDPAVVAALGGIKATDEARALQDVRLGKVDAYIAYPSDPAAQTVRVYARDAGLFENGTYSAVATHILVTSARRRIDAKLAALVQGEFGVTTTIYKAGRESSGIGEIVPPLMFLAVFYVVMLLLGNQMTTSLLEEKENRVSEMILTTVEPTTMVIGKVISLFIIGLVQVLAFAVPVVVGYLELPRFRWHLETRTRQPVADAAPVSARTPPETSCPATSAGGAGCRSPRCSGRSRTSPRPSS